MCKPAVAIEKLLSERRKAEPTPETLVRCPECGAQVSYAGMEEHLSSCPQITISCPNGCEKTLLLLELVGHAAECPLAIVTCPHGCGTMNDTLTRHTLQAHMENYVQLHLQYLARKVEEQGEVIKAFEKSSPTGAAGSCCASLRNRIKNACNVMSDDARRREFLKTHFPPRTLFILVACCIGLMMLCTMPGIVQIIFALICWRKRPRQTGDDAGPARARFFLQALVAVSLLFVIFQFPFWVLAFVVAPLAGLCYLSRAELFASVQQVINA